MTDWPPWLVRGRDGLALWLTWYDIAMKDAKNFAYLAVLLAGNSVTLSQMGLSGYVLPVTVITLVATVPAVWAYVRLLKIPNEKERREKRYKSNYVSPGNAIQAYCVAAAVWAIQEDADPFAAVDRVLTEHNRGVDMDQFERELEGD